MAERPTRRLAGFGLVRRKAARRLAALGPDGAASRLPSPLTYLRLWLFFPPLREDALPFLALALLIAAARLLDMPSSRRLG